MYMSAEKESLVASDYISPSGSLIGVSIYPDWTAEFTVDSESVEHRLTEEAVLCLGGLMHLQDRVVTYHDLTDEMQSINASAVTRGAEFNSFITQLDDSRLLRSTVSLLYRKPNNPVASNMFMFGNQSRKRILLSSNLYEESSAFERIKELSSENSETVVLKALRELNARIIQFGGKSNPDNLMMDKNDKDPKTSKLATVPTTTISAQQPEIASPSKSKSISKTSHADEDNDDEIVAGELDYTNPKKYAPVLYNDIKNSISGSEFTVESVVKVLKDRGINPRSDTINDVFEIALSQGLVRKESRKAQQRNTPEELYFIKT